MDASPTPALDAPIKIAVRGAHRPLRRHPGADRRVARRPGAPRDRAHRTVRLRQVDLPALPQPDERPHPRHPDRGQHHASTARTSTATTSTRSSCDGASAWCSRSPTRSRSRSSRTSPIGPRIHGLRDPVAIKELVERSLRQAALWDEVADRLDCVGARALGRPAAAALHRARARGPARGAAHGRARLGARSDRHRQDRGADPGAQAGLYNRHRDA